MRVTGARFLAGPNIHDDASGVVIDNEMASLPPAGAPLASPRGRSDRVFAALDIADLADDWAAAAAQGRAALPAFVLHLATALASRASIFPSDGRIILAADPRLVAFLRCEHETIGLAAWDCAGKAALACLGGDDELATFEAAHARFRRVARQLRAGLITAAFAHAARRLDLPWYRLKIPGEHVQLGQGVHRRYMLEALTDGVGGTSQLMSQDKFLTNRMLGAAGVPVLPMMEVSSEAGAVAAAERLGYPVVVKPCHGGQGRAVAINLTDATQVAAAYRAAAERDSVVIERFAPGHDHRVLVLGGRIIGAARRVEDGRAIDVTDAIHRDNRSILERAATATGLAFVEIGFLSEDIARSWREAGGGVLGLDTLPDLRRHWLAHPGRGVIEPILRSLLPPGSDGRIPTAAITGSVGKTTTANMVARILVTMGLVVGRCTTAGITVGDERRRTDDCAGGRYARNLLFDRRVEAGVFELARRGLLNEGMAIDDCDVGAVLNIYDNHIGSDGIATRADLARIKSIVARRARRMLVLNAEDPLCLAMREGARAERICLVAADEEAPVMRAHIAAGNCAAFRRGDAVVLADQGAADTVLATTEIPATLSGRHRGKVWNAMFAVAIARAMGASLDQIRAGLRSFKPDLADSQGRLSIIDRHPFRVILDYGAGREALGALADAVRQMPVAGRKLVYLMGSGRSSDEFLRVTGRAVAGAFDVYVCTDWARRPRPDPQTVPDLMRDGLLAGGVTPDAILSIVGEEAALQRLLAAAAPGDLVVVNTAEIDSAAALIESFAPIEPAGDRNGGGSERLPGRGGPFHPVTGPP